jgi:hypothetical protein
VLVRGDLSNERALADLARAENRDSSAVCQRVHHVFTEVTREERLGHAADRICEGGRIRTKDKADCE